MHNLQPFIDSLQGFAQKRLSFKRPPKLFFKQDEENAKDVFGKTAYYDPEKESITLFTLNRHPKDILRSLAHELVHHTQNLRGDLSPEKCGSMGPGYAQTDDHMREMEREAYERGNLCFRDWEDKCKSSATDKAILQLKENKNMSVKISKKELKELISKLFDKKLEESSKADKEVEEATGPICVDRRGNQGRKNAKGDCIAKKASRKPTNEDLEVEEEEGTLEEVECVHEAGCGCPDGDPLLIGDRGGEEEGELDLRTPEDEETAYKIRFENRNNKLYERLMSKWTK